MSGPDQDLRTAGFQGVGLAELTARAGLMHRVDRKYILDADQLDQVLDRLPRTTRVLEIEGRTSFGYRSLYYDTPALDSYRMAAHGRPRRYKVRSRRYLDAGGSFLEVKTRTGAQSHKHRIAAGELDQQGRLFVGRVLDQARLDAGQVAQLQPVLATDYVRRTLLAPRGDARLTIDTRLSWSPSGPADCPAPVTLTVPQLVIVETKTEGAPTVLDQVLWRCGHRPQRISKYATGMAALHPELPHNRWSRTLRRHFSQPQPHL